MPRFLSLGFLLSVAGIAYVANTVWTFYGIYFPAWCKAGGTACIHPKFLCEKTNLLYEGWISRAPFLPNGGPNADAVRVFAREGGCDVAWEETFTFDVEPIWKKDATFYVHVLVLPRNKLKLGQETVVEKLSPSHPSVVYQKTIMTKYLVEERTAINLIQAAGEEKNDSASVKSRTEVLHWHTKLRLHVMDTPITFERMSIPHELYPFLKLKNEKNGAMSYMPLVYIDSLSAKREEFIPLKAKKNKSELKNSNSNFEKSELKNSNSNLNSDLNLNLTVEYSPISVGKIRLISMIFSSMEQLKIFGLKENDLEEVVSIFTETNFYILTLTIIVTVLHLIFDFMAFKNDVLFWRKKETIVGLSGRTIVWRAFSQIIVFFYLMEEKSSLLISIPAGIACVIEIWKVLKLWKFTGFERGSWGFRMKFDKSSAAEKSCDDLDADFFKKLSYLLLPLCLGGATYSLFYVPHKSFYSWTIQSAVNFVYAFGFLFMIPQLYLNYKLKSVSHLPWKVFGYKAINTFIDDLFAFIVKMPLAHRLACFRDDIVFVFYLVQLYLYPVDKTRPNEFGQSFDDAQKETPLESKTVESKKTK